MIAGMNIDTGQKTWLTPKWIVDALGPFDMDPCVPDHMPWSTATRMVTKAEDGLVVPWKGAVWLNPPYGRESLPFLMKMASHRNGVALLFGRTDTRAWHQYVFPVCDSVLFMRGRISFYREDGTCAGGANAPSALVSYTAHFTAKLKDAGIPGYLVKCNGHCGVCTAERGALYEG